MRSRVLFSLMVLALLVFLPSSPGAANDTSLLETGPIEVEKVGENRAIRLVVHSYSRRFRKLGDPAPEGKVFLVIRGALINKNAEKGASVPPVQKAFTLRVGSEMKVTLDPISEDTADPFWGPLILEPGEELPIEMVFVVPAEPLEQANLQHLSNMGPMNINLIGDPIKSPSSFLAGPVSKGEVEVAVERVDFASTHKNEKAPDGWRYATVNFLFTSLLELEPLETNLPSLTVLVEDGGYVYRPLNAPQNPKDQVETYFPQEPTAKTMVFLVPELTGNLTFVHFSKKGALSLDLTPGVAGPELKVVGKPNAGRSVSLRLFQSEAESNVASPQSGKRYVVLDIGLQLTVNDPMASLSFDPLKALELHAGNGQFYKPANIGNQLRRPLGLSEIWRDQVVRGDVAFLVPTNAKDFVLKIPFSSGAVALKVPDQVIDSEGVKSATTRVLPQPEAPSSKKPQKKPKSLFGGILPVPTPPSQPNPIQPTPDLPSSQEPIGLTVPEKAVGDKSNVLARLNEKISDSAIREALFAKVQDAGQLERLASSPDEEIKAAIEAIEIEKQSGPKVHNLDRYGPSVSDAALQRRITEGLAPDDVWRPENRSARFTTYEDWVKSYHVAKQVAKTHGFVDSQFGPGEAGNGTKAEYQIVVEFDREIGTGFFGEGKKRKVSNPKNSRQTQKLYPAASPFPKGPSRVHTVFRWNGRGGQWEVVRHIPELRGFESRTGTYASKVRHPPDHKTQ